MNNELLEAKASFCPFKEKDFEHALIVLKEIKKDINWLVAKFYNYLHDTCIYANNIDVVSFIYNHIFIVAMEELKKYDIDIEDMNFSIHGTQFDFFYDSVEELNDEIKYNNIVIKNLEPETIYFLKEVGIKED